jgi:uncharacterized SAM-binding protein YcdF (DUF218 family)
MNTQETPTPEEELTWPETPSAIFILGKRQGTKKENKELWGRVAMAAALWHSAPQPKPYIAFMASDVHGPLHTPDAEVVKSMLVEEFEIPPDFLILRQRTHCTLLEVRAARTLHRAYGLAQIFALTHLYHAPRAQRYFNEVLPNVAVIPVHPDILAEIAFPEEYDDLLPELETMIQKSMPSRLNNLREHIVEWLLSTAHIVDSRGRFERWLAKVLRPRAYR